MDLAIQLDRVTKRYRAGRSRTVVDLIGSALERARGRAQDVHSTTRGRIDADIWALRDVSLDVPEAAGVGVIGRNGAGKTTLLKLISRVTWPSNGRVRVAWPLTRSWYVVLSASG
jgi:lipopolysaccharide transport system ATP-binding protein